MGLQPLFFQVHLDWCIFFSSSVSFFIKDLLPFFATQIDTLGSDALMDIVHSEMTATGGVMILAIGLNIIGFTKIRVG